jgi:hypothetical protein
VTTAEEAIQAARARLHAVPENGDPAEDAATGSEGGGRARYELVITGKGAPKTEPKNVRWLRSQLGHRHLPWAFLRSGRVVKVNGVGENGYQQPAHSHDDNGPATVAALTGRSLSTLLADAVYCYVIRETDKGKKYDTEEWFPESDCARALDQPDLLPYLRPLRGVTHTPLPRAGQSAKSFAQVNGGVTRCIPRSPGTGHPRPVARSASESGLLDLDLDTLHLLLRAPAPR